MKKGRSNTMKKISKAIALVLALCMLCSLAACGKKDDNADGKTVVTVWSNNRHDEVYMNQMVEAFNNSHDNIRIDYVIMTDDWANSIQLAFQAKTAPDVITIAASDGMTLQNYVDANMFEPLNTYIDGDADFKKVTEPYDHKYEGLNALGDTMYWVPNGVRSGTRIEYNTELVAAAGANGIPRTLDELVKLAADVTAQGGGSTYGVGFTSSGPFGRWLEGVGTLSGATNNGYDYKNGRFDFSSWVPVLEKAAQLNAQGSVLPGSFESGVDASRAQFAAGAFAIWGNASQEAGVFTDQFPPAFDWGVAELPTLDGTIKGALACTPNFGFAMLTSAKDKAAAWEVISYFSSEEVLKGYFEGGYSIPLSNYMADKFDASKTGRLADFALKDYEDVFPSTPAVTIEGDDFYKVAQNVLQGYVSAQEACDDLTTRYNQALERGLQQGSCTRVVIADYDPLHPSAGTVQLLTE